jgi:hypothetical protein
MREKNKEAKRSFEKKSASEQEDFHAAIESRRQTDKPASVQQHGSP